ncbi:MAG: hypothetical protein LBE49_02115 [Deltaproteobacteria bacterium]|jgi:L-arginine dehydrogenase|nr:hypothetical protein [Deltaproteobacteria bacterium]
MGGEKKPAAGGKKKTAALAASEKDPKSERVVIATKRPPSGGVKDKVEFKLFDRANLKFFEASDEEVDYIHEMVADFYDTYEDDLFRIGLFDEDFPRAKTLEMIFKRGVSALRHDFEAGRFDPSGLWRRERNPAYQIDQFEPVNVWPGPTEPLWRLMKQLDLRDLLLEAFADLHEGRAVQPPQSLTLFPGARGDFITYLGVIEKLDIFGIKVSPFIPANTPKVTAYTLLMSIKTGAPLLLTSSIGLTAERTAATTALALELLADKKAKTMAVIGSGKLAIAHILRCEPVRDWKEIRIYSPHIFDEDRMYDLEDAFGPYRPTAKMIAVGSAKEAVQGADAVILCTSSAEPVIDFADLSPKTVVTSISTNAPMAHEIAPESLPMMDVFCDYAENTPLVAGEMVIASKAGIWSREAVVGDLPSLCAEFRKLGAAFKPPVSGDRPVFFRSVGLGLEDVIAAYALYKKAGDKYTLTISRIIEDEEL